MHRAKHESEVGKANAKQRTSTFGQMSDDSLLKIGVPISDLDRLRSATSDDDILRIIEEYETAIQERVLALVDNPLCLRSMLESIANEKPRRSISQIIKTNVADRANYFILTPGLQTRFFAGQIENWQVTTCGRKLKEKRIIEPCILRMHQIQKIFSENCMAIGNGEC